MRTIIDINFFLQPCPHAFPLPLLYKLKANYVKKEKEEGEHGDKAYHYWWVGGGGGGELYRI